MAKEIIGLYSGSFNPIHQGHLIIAEYILQHTPVDKIWFVLSPHNPLKEERELLNQSDRLRLVQMAIEDNESFVASDVEFFLPKPSYTLNTLEFLSSNYPDKEFRLIIGQDNLQCFDSWHNYKKILSDYKIYVYPRLGQEEIKFFDQKNVISVSAPIIEISSTYIRECIRDSKSIKYLVPQRVIEEIEKKEYYL